MRHLPAIVMALGVTTAAYAQPHEPVAAIRYTYPAQVRAIPVLHAWFDAQEASLRSAVIAEATADRNEAAKDGRPFLSYDSDRLWQVVTDTPRFLSLSLRRYDFTGGAHGNSSYSALIWDRVTNRRLAPISFFQSAVQLKAAIMPAFCRQLDAQRRDKRKGDGGTKSGIPEFDRCIDPIKEVIILGSSTRRQFDRIGIIIAPYDAGPFAEGTYDVTLPVTPAILAAVRPESRRYFAVKAGSPGTP